MTKPVDLTQIPEGKFQELYQMDMFDPGKTNVLDEWKLDQRMAPLRRFMRGLINQQHTQFIERNAHDRHAA